MLKGENVHVKSFPGAKTVCMLDYMKPSLKNIPDVILLHVGTNNLQTDNTPEDISNDIINLATTSKNSENDIIISGIVGRNDALNSKATEVNNFLKPKCDVNNFTFCDNSKHLKKLSHKWQWLDYT